MIVTLPHPEIFRSFAELTFFAWYRGLLTNVAAPNATAITALVVVLELAAGLLILSRGTAVRIGLVSTALWIVFLMPSMGWYTVWSPLLLVVPLWLMRFTYQDGVIGLFLQHLDRTSRGV